MCANRLQSVRQMVLEKQLSSLLLPSLKDAWTTMALATAHQRHDFHTVAICQFAIGVFFTRDQLLITLDRTITILDAEFEQQIGDCPVCRNSSSFAVEDNVDHGRRSRTLIIAREGRVSA